MPVVVIAASPLARAVGIDTWVVGIVALAACNTFFLPYQSTMYLALYNGSERPLFRHAQARPLSVAYAMLVLAGLAVSVPYWQAMGLV